ncbi:hypothetical protein [Fusobacterium perfoetens]|nr:hypothetical protein [Fusobacterium perfoetens]MCI6151816.1 hypothetical protein [Fusobacterium perfoetens]MDY3236823.1 hypothetical protein [Fusobacterium perfoetens]
MNKNFDREIELQMEKSLKKIPWEIKKIKFILTVIKKWKKFISLFR